MKIVLSILIIAVAGSLAWCEYQTARTSQAEALADQQEIKGDTLDVTLAGETFTLELAVDDDARYKGLSDRPSIDKHGGMLFGFRYERVRQFVMRRCLVDIDIAYLDERGRIVKTYTMKKEPYDTDEDDLKHYSSIKPALIAIELRAGTIKRLGLKVGQTVDLPIRALKRRAR